MSWETKVMTLGSVNVRSYGSSGIGAAGEPAWMGMGYRHPRPTSPMSPQNLLRPTNKGCGCNDVGVPGLSPFGKVALGALSGKKGGDNRCVGKTPALGGAWVTDENGMSRYVPSTVDAVYGLAGLVGGGMGVYHGYRRAGGWGALGYGLLGAFIPIVGIPVFFIQGFGKKRRRR